MTKNRRIQLLRLSQSSKRRPRQKLQLPRVAKHRRRPRLKPLLPLKRRKKLRSLPRKLLLLKPKQLTLHASKPLMTRRWPAEPT